MCSCIPQVRIDFDSIRAITVEPTCTYQTRVILMYTFTGVMEEEVKSCLFFRFLKIGGLLISRPLLQTSPTFDMFSMQSVFKSLSTTGAARSGLRRAQQNITDREYHSDSAARRAWMIRSCLTTNFAWIRFYFLIFIQFSCRYEVTA